MPNPPGQLFRKCDLHTHTPASRCYRFKEHTPAELVQAALDQQLEAIAVTDHNSGAWIDMMKEAAKNSGLTIFPGVEISAHENYHVVAIFDPKAGRAEVEGLLSALDFMPEEFGNSEVTCKRSIYDIFKVARDRGALVTLAHIDEIKGAFFQQIQRTISEKTGEPKIYVPATCAQLFNHEGYHAVEVTQGRLPEGFDNAHGIRRVPAFYQSSDNPDPDLPTKHSKFGYAGRYSWFSMDEIGLEGLRQCFADPEVRIRQLHEYNPHQWPYIMSIKFGPDGFLAYQNFAFHPGLNCLIGHKGTGKSLAIEALRFGLGQATAQEDLRKDHIGKLDTRLGVLNTVEVEIMHANGTIYRITGKNEGKGKATRTCVNAETGDVYTGDIARLFPVLAYSQTEVIKIAEDEEAQLRLADALIDARPIRTAIEAIQADLAHNDVQVAEAIGARYKLEESLAEAATLQERISNIDKMLSNDLLTTMRAAERKSASLTDQTHYVGALKVLADRFIADIEAVELPSLPDAHANDAELIQGQVSLEALLHDVRLSITTILGQITGAQTTIDQIKSKWTPNFAALRQQYDELLQGTDAARLEVERRSTNTRLDEVHRAVGRHRRQAEEELPELLRFRNDLLDRLESEHERYFNVRLGKFNQLSAASEGKVQLQLAHATNNTEYARQLSDALKGGDTKAISTPTRQKIAESVKPRRLGELIIDHNAEELATAAGITPEMAERTMQRLWGADNFGEVLALQHAYFPVDTPTILFRKGEEYSPIHELSVGQKCTALLIIALCDGAMPVIIDQPEDALDIASVWDDVARKLRQGKQGRQFILTTHNSSLAVGSDSDAFCVLEPVGSNRAKVTLRGAIDRAPVRKAVIDHLEGGDQPYLLKHQKYNVG